jgi:hypothetical protein
MLIFLLFSNQPSEDLNHLEPASDLIQFSQWLSDLHVEAQAEMAVFDFPNFRLEFHFAHQEAPGEHISSLKEIYFLSYF